jgi:hypothetical protein
MKCYNIFMNTKPYFLWDYDLTEADVIKICILIHQKVLDHNRILESAKYEDI